MNNQEQSKESLNSNQGVDKEAIKLKMMEEAKNLKVREVEGPYTFDNPHLEHKTKRQKKTEDLEAKYRNKPKIAFHTLNDEGNLKYMQIKRDYVWTIIGWSFIGNFAGVFVVQYIENSSKRWKNLRHFQRREVTKVFGFIGAVAAFTYYGYGRARQEFIKGKLNLVELHSIKHSEK